MDEAQFQLILERAVNASENRMMARFDAKFEAMDQKFDAKFDAMEGKFQAVDTSITDIKNRLPKTEEELANESIIGIYDTIWPFRRFWVPFCPKTWIKPD